MDIRFMRDISSSALLEYHTDEFKESRPDLPYHLDRYFNDEEYSDWQRVSFSIDPKETLKEVIENIKYLEEFTRRQIEDPSFSKGFIWEINQRFNWFKAVPDLVKHFEEEDERQNEELLIDRSTNGPYPFVCKYSHHVPSLATEVSGKLISAIILILRNSNIIIDNTSSSLIPTHRNGV